MRFEELGTDLKVILGPPAMAAHDTSPLDLRMDSRFFSSSQKGTYDFQTISGRETLAQAMILRLLTPKGSLAELGHAEYGSRLSELIGRRKTAAIRALCKAYVLEAVAQEPRVEDKAVSFSFDIPSEGPSEMRFNLAIKPKTDPEPVTLNFAVAL